ncbi:MAG: hypothetical protein JNL82_11325 [Myxococcales bacterium]|nr:hypothetical protein [Myxococcales bacterium]
MTSGPALQSLLAHLDGLSYGERVRHVVGLARAAATPQPGPVVATGALALIDSLLAGDAYQAGLAVEMAQAVRDAHRLAAALTHRSFGVRRTAAGYLVRLLPDAPPAPVPADSSSSADRPVSPAILDVPALIHGLAPALRRAALKGLVRAGRRAAAAALFPEVLARHGPREAAALLPALDAAALRVQLPQLAHAGPAWRALLLRHPHVVVDHLHARLTAAPPRDRPDAWVAHRGLVGALAELRPHALFDLLEAYPDTCPAWLLVVHLGELARAEPTRLLAALERPPMRALLAHQSLPRPLLNQLHRFTPEQHVRLARLGAEDPEQLAPLLHALPPSQRAAVLEGALAGQDRRHRVWPEALLIELPHAVRRAEAARMLGLPEVQADPDHALELTAHLELATAAPALWQASQAGEAGERARALARLVRCAARDTASDDGFPTTLARVAQRLRNEQDPVRLTVLSAVAAVPPGSFAVGDSEALRALVRSVVDARDSSHATQQAVRTLAFNLLRAHAGAPDGALFDLGLELLHTLSGKWDSISLPDLSQGLPKKTASALVAALRPRVEAAAARERPGLVFALAQALGKRGHGLQPLLDLIEPLTTSKPDSVAGAAIDLLLQDPIGRDDRVRRLIAADRSVITRAPVLAHLHRRRQAWLDPYLDGSRISGRFLTGKTLHVLPVHDGFHRWLPRQQHAHARLLARAADDRGHAHLTRAAVVAALARLPVTTVADLEPYLRSDEVSVVEAALGALAWIDTPAAALPVLLDNLDGDRARVAMYAIPRVARFLPPDELGATLAGLLTEHLQGKPPRKLTVRKEALRLLGVHRSAHSLPTLFAVLAQPDLHKDLAVAVGHAARNLLDDPRAHGLLASLAASSEPDVARSLLEVHPDRLPLQARAAYGRLVLTVARHPDLTARRAATRALALWSAGQETDVAEHLAAVILDLERGATWAEAAVALVAVCSEQGEALAPVARVVAGLAARADEQVAARDGDASPPPTSLAPPLAAREQQVATRERDASPPPTSLAPPLAARAAAPTAGSRDLPARQRLFAVYRALVDLEPHVRLSLRTGLAAVAERLAADDLWPQAAGLRLAGLDLAADDSVAALRDLAADARADAFLPELVAGLTDHLARGAAVEPQLLLARAAALAPASARAARLALALVESAGARSGWPDDAVTALAALRAHPDLRVRAAARAVFTRPEATA